MRNCIIYTISIRFIGMRDKQKRLTSKSLVQCTSLLTVSLFLTKPYSVKKETSPSLGSPNKRCPQSDAQCLCGIIYHKCIGMSSIKNGSPTIATTQMRLAIYKETQEECRNSADAKTSAIHPKWESVKLRKSAVQRTQTHGEPLSVTDFAYSISQRK